ncbi:alcohol dehydrogenase [Clostridium thermosuccinogenes]|jgi:short-subunit dehydrogenase|uniref:Alcohol dehydrogenase n=1 Tax=Clostridium thermosuccinogenes TaxID=84032 RepID=A0A2K2FB38_9CLOT|nr:SDR family NAD(P)-dependent oxidoreductase [Pseudoclostridium thermosuccinogenes]AUS97098.1 alcohol dehydrogenase [Pseudoclostridium thermosuccinogenes]PNT95138.1 alcohol dehydrogenase [Pseudoclostridium thermosuccinogenes]PNT95974.1 alcohol dehydrogenase [Pseudoclostridium thermosuccinogenes]
MKNVVITGSTRGIGFAMAKEFLRAGCNVTLSGRGEALPEAARDELSPFEGKYIYVRCNVQEKASLQNLWDVSLKQWGKIDIWINNAGQNVPHMFSWETGETYTENVIKTNITGMIYGSQIAAAEMIKQGYGAIYSMEGLGSNDMIQPKTILYGTTKRALRYFMKGLARELKGTGVIAGRLSPGMMLTDFITKTPDGDPSEVISDEKFRRLFNILADRPETVAKFFIPRILKNTKNDALISWLTNRKAAWRFITAGFRRGRLI